MLNQNVPPAVVAYLTKLVIDYYRERPDVIEDLRESDDLHEEISALIADDDDLWQDLGCSISALIDDEQVVDALFSEKE